MYEAKQHEHISNSKMDPALQRKRDRAGIPPGKKFKSETMQQLYGGKKSSKTGMASH